MEIFYTMSKKKGDMAIVWMAAHFPKRLRKDLIQHTNISSSVDKILVDQLPVVTYRILGFLLLGVVRIYSKKVEYLLHDCNKGLNEIKYHFEERKISNINIGGMRAPEYSGKRRSSTFVDAMRVQFSSISLPENFELDAFDLEVVEDGRTKDNVKPNEEITLNDAYENDRTWRHSFSKDGEEVSASSAGYDAAYILITKNSETSAEKLRHRFSLEECLEPMVLGDADKELQLDARPSPKHQEPEENTKRYDEHEVMMCEDDGHPDKEEHHDDEEECRIGETMVSEMTSVDHILKLKPHPEKRPLSNTIYVTPEPKGEHKSDFVAIRTPVTKEHVRASRKRKCVFDNMTVVPNSVFKDWLADASDLVGKRRKAPTTLLAWRDCRLFNASHSFVEPIIPINAGVSSNVRSVISENKMELIDEMVEPASKIERVGSPQEEAEAIAPSTPVAQSTSLRFSDIPGTSKPNDVEPTSSSEGDKSRETKLYSIKDLQLDEMSMNEESNSLEGDSQENVKWSARTKIVASYLYSNFIHTNKRGEDEALNLTRILKKKSRKESARFFYELLVLKTGGYVEVRQEKGYSEICIMGTSKLKKALGKG